MSAEAGVKGARGWDCDEILSRRAKQRQNTYLLATFGFPLSWAVAVGYMYSFREAVSGNPTEASCCQRAHGLVAQ